MRVKKEPLYSDIPVCVSFMRIRSWWRPQANKLVNLNTQYSIYLHVVCTCLWVTKTMIYLKAWAANIYLLASKEYWLCSSSVSVWVLLSFWFFYLIFKCFTALPSCFKLLNSSNKSQNAMTLCASDKYILVTYM